MSKRATKRIAVMHRRVREHADDLSEGAASATRDRDSYLLALIQLVICAKVPCRRAVIRRLHAMAQREGFEQRKDIECGWCLIRGI